MLSSERPPIYVHISADVQRITLNASCMKISGGRTKQLVIIAGFLTHHWLYDISFIVVENTQLFHGALQMEFL